MLTVAIVIASFVLYLVAYRTYGRFLARRVFRVDPDRLTPACRLEDGVDFVPSRRSLVFGHHFTSIAGTGPIVGPAIAVVWGWVPALVWVLVGSILMGAVHDFGSLVVSMRHDGRTVADLAGDVVNRRVRLLFMIVCVVGLWIVLAVFGLVIATIFSLYPSSLIPVWAQIPIAVGLGVWIRRGGSLMLGSIVAVVLMYATIAWSASIDFTQVAFPPESVTAHISPVAFWTLILMVYVFIASVLPVQTLLQPRDFINSWQLLIAMGLLVAGLLFAHPEIVADPVRLTPEPGPKGAAPPMMPFLFITIACGAVSGFHCLVASGCSSRQLRTERDAQYVGYGAMLTEGFLAVLVILACVAGIGLADGTAGGPGAYDTFYKAWGGDSGLGSMLSPFVEGSANVIGSLGIPRGFAVALMGVFIASFAATTLDSATRLQRYIISELAGAARENPPPIARALGNRFVATGLAVTTAIGLALSDIPEKGLSGAGLGGLVLWPIFGATNQLLAGLALLVVTVWLVRTRSNAWVTAVPMVFMLGMTAYALVRMIAGFHAQDRHMLLVIAAAMIGLQCWIAAEALLLTGSRTRRAGLGGSSE